MKKFAASLGLCATNAIFVGDTPTADMNDPKTETPINTEGQPKLSVTYASQKYTDADSNVSYMLMMGFTVDNSGPTPFEAGNYILSYAQFPDPDASGKFSSFTCTVKFDPSSLYADAGGATDGITIVNYYGETSLMKDKVELSTFDMLNSADILKQGPWTLAGDPTSTEANGTTWE